MLTPYRRHRLAGSLIVIFFFAYSFFAIFFKYSPFPFFDWELFSAAPQITTIYEVQVTALQPDIKLEQPIPLHKLSPEFHKNWNPSPYNLVQKWGWMLDESAWQGTLSLSHRHIRDYFTSDTRIFPGHRSQDELALQQKLVENYFRYFPYIEYQLVKITYSTATYWHDKHPISLEVIASFKKNNTAL